MALTKDQIFAADDLKTIEVDVPEWGGKIKLRTMTGTEREIYFRRLMKYKSEDIPKDLFQTIVIICAVDDSGKAIFNFDDLPKLAQKNGSVLDRVMRAASELNGLTDKSIEQMSGE